tara:strand:+ start:106 stop:570 length:465 start_codon:yes stop_codon:yes gene_type:complete
MTCIKGFENYKIYEDGKIINKHGYEMKSQKSINGYLNITLCKNSKHKTFLLHRLLGQAYIKNQDNKPFIDHIDRNRSNNDLSNLHWVTSLENNQNKGIPNTNTSGIKNIHWDKSSNGWKFEKVIKGKLYTKFSQDKQFVIDYKSKILLEHNLKD